MEEAKNKIHKLTVEVEFAEEVTMKQAREIIIAKLTEAKEISKAESQKKVDWDEACRLKSQGKTNKQIAEAVGASVGIIANKIAIEMTKRDFGAESKEYVSKIDWDKACALKKAGWTTKAIAEELKASPNTIRCMLPKKYSQYLLGHRDHKEPEPKEEEWE